MSIASILDAATVIIGTSGGVRTAIQSTEVSTSVQVLTTKPNSITKKPVSTSPVTFTGLNPDSKYAFTATPMLGTAKGIPAGFGAVVADGYYVSVTHAPPNGFIDNGTTYSTSTEA